MFQKWFIKIFENMCISHVFCQNKLQVNKPPNLTVFNAYARNLIIMTFELLIILEFIIFAF